MHLIKRQFLIMQSPCILGSAIAFPSFETYLISLFGRCDKVFHVIGFQLDRCKTRTIVLLVYKRLTSWLVHKLLFFLFDLPMSGAILVRHTHILVFTILGRTIC